MSTKPAVIVITVTTAGTRVQVSTTPIYAETVNFEGLRGNTGFMYIGDITVTSAIHAFSVASAVSKALPASVKTSKDRLIDLSTIYIDGSVNGEKCLVSYMKQSDNE